MWGKNSKIRYILLLVVLIFIISGCGSKTSVDVEPEKTVPVKVTVSELRIYLNFSPFRKGSGS